MALDRDLPRQLLRGVLLPQCLLHLHDKCIRQFWTDELGRGPLVAFCLELRRLDAALVFSFNFVLSLSSFFSSSVFHPERSHSSKPL